MSGAFLLMEGADGVRVEDFIVEIGLPVSLQDLGVDENTDLKAIADSCVIMPGSYKKMTHEEIYAIFKECF